MITKRAEYRIHGMDCAEEVSLLRRALSGRAGIFDLAFDIFQGKLAVEFDGARIVPEQIETAIRETGMRAEAWREGETGRRTFWERRGRNLLTAASGCALAGGMAWQAAASGDLVGSLLAHQHGHHDLPAGALALYWVAIVSGAAFAVPKAAAAWRALRPDMNALVVFSLLGAAMLGEWTEAATLSFLFGLAGMLESWSIGRAREAISKLLKIAPAEATVIHAGAHDGHAVDHEHEHRVRVDRIGLGSRVRVKPGERIPFDGEVVRGTSYVNQALITGESVPVEKGEGDCVWAGTMNDNGMLEIRTTRVAADTTLARMVRMVEQSQSRRAPSEQFVERFTRYYTPAVFALALLVMVLPPLAAGASWGEWFYQGMVVLLISCPCALVISTPVSVVAGLTAAARNGVLIKGGAYLEEAARVKAMAFDKTGVLTQGNPEVCELVALDGRGERRVLQHLAALESGSEHPLARAILRYAERSGVAPPPPHDFQALQGRGAEGFVEGHNFWVGSLRMLREKGLETATVRAALERLADSEHTVVACGSDDEAWALLQITDPPRAEAAGVVAALRRAGVRRLEMLTGDNKTTGRSVSASTGLDAMRAELLPEDKAARVRELVAEYGHAAMVGDGVNDAQALTEATLGIGVGRRGADVILETADVVLMSGDLRQLPFLVQHARRTLRVIQQNIWFALSTKVVFLVFAVLGSATLWMAVAADMGATFLVTFNGLRLLRAPAAARE